MLVVWKEKIKFEDINKSEVVIKVPKGAKFMNVASQNYNPVIWFECDNEEELEEQKIYLRGTGQHFNGNEGKYIGTAHIKIKGSVPKNGSVEVKFKYMAVHLYCEKKGLLRG